MKLLLFTLIFLVIFAISAKPAQAIIVLVPIALIPVVKIVVLIITALTTPVVGLSALYFKLKKKSVWLGILMGIVILLILGGILYFTIDIFAHKSQSL